MALPTIISSDREFPVGDQYNGGIFQVGSKTYVVLVDTSTDHIVYVYSATDPTASWTLEDSSFDNTADKLNNYYVIEDGGKLYIYARDDKSTSILEGIFDCSTDAFTQEMTTIEGNATGNDARGTVVGVFRSDGDRIIAFGGENENIGGTNYNRIDYIRYEGVSWSSNMALDGGGEAFYRGTSICLADSDTVWFCYLDTTNQDYIVRDLTSGNTLNTEQKITGTFGFVHPLSTGVYYLDGSVDKVRFTVLDSAATAGSQLAEIYIDDGTLNGSLQNVGIEDSDVTTDDENRFWLSPTMDGTTRLMVYYDTGNDINWTKSEDDGAWDADTEAQALSSVEGLFCNVIDRSGKKLAYVYDSSTGVTYNEIDLEEMVETDLQITITSSVTATDSRTTDVAIYRRASAISDITETTFTKLVFDTDKKSVGYVFSNGVIACPKGKHLVMYGGKITAGSTGTGNAELQTAIFQDGVQLAGIYGRASAFIPDTNNAVDDFFFSATIVDIVGNGDTIDIRYKRTDDNTGSQNVDIVADTCAVMILKLDDDWNYGRFRGSTEIQGIVATYGGMDLDDTDEDTASKITRGTGAQSDEITLAEPGHYMAFFQVGYEGSTAPPSIQGLSCRLIRADGETPVRINGLYGGGFSDPTNDCFHVIGSGGGIFDIPDPDTVVNLEVRAIKEEGTVDLDLDSVALVIVKLSEGADYLRARNSSNDIWSATEAHFAFDTVDEEDTGSFDIHFSGEIRAEDTNDYLFWFATMCGGASTSNRSVVQSRLELNGTTGGDIQKYGYGGHHIRHDAGADSVDLTVFSYGTIVSLLDTDYVRVMEQELANDHDDQNLATTIGFFGLNIGTLTNPNPYQELNLQVNITAVITATDGLSFPETDRAFTIISADAETDLGAFSNAEKFTITSVDAVSDTANFLELDRQFDIVSAFSETDSKGYHETNLALNIISTIAIADTLTAVDVTQFNIVSGLSETDAASFLEAALSLIASTVVSEADTASFTDSHVFTVVSVLSELTEANFNSIDKQFTINAALSVFDSHTSGSSYDETNRKFTIVSTPSESDTAALVDQDKALVIASGLTGFDSRGMPEPLGFTVVSQTAEQDSVGYVDDSGSFVIVADIIESDTVALVSFEQFTVIATIDKADLFAGADQAAYTIISTLTETDVYSPVGGNDETDRQFDIVAVVTGTDAQRKIREIKMPVTMDVKNTITSLVVTEQHSTQMIVNQLVKTSAEITPTETSAEITPTETKVVI